MSLPNTYVYVYGQINDFLETIKKGQAPEKFTQQYLKDLGFTSSNHKGFIPLLKTLGFLTPNGNPTERYHHYRNDAESKKILGEALKENYSDIFSIRSKPKTDDFDLIQGKFKSTHNTSDRNSELMAKTFFSLLDLADLNGKMPPNTNYEEVEEKQNEEPEIVNPINKHPKPSLHYNIQIHLPATKDIEVYNAIFRSLKEHLID